MFVINGKMFGGNKQTGSEATYDRLILHCDCNCFFASVEMVAHPEYRSVPMAVCGSRADRHGIVLAKNELAKKAGITTGEVIWQAKKKCPSLVIAEPHYDLYEEYSAEANRIFSEYTDMIEPFGIDESWLDVTGSTRLFGSGKKIADEIRNRMRNELGITSSVGVSFNKTFAKLGSDYKKPDATTVITPDNYKQILFPLPIGDMLYIGRHTVPRMKLLGINTIGDLASSDEDMLVSQFGKMGKTMYDLCSGRDVSPVISVPPKAKSYSNGMTFVRDLEGERDYRAAVTYLVEKVSARMRRDGAKCRVVGVAVRDTLLNVSVRNKKINSATSATELLINEFWSLLVSNWDISKAARSITLLCSSIENVYPSEQIKFFYSSEETKRMKAESLDNSVDKLRERYGKGIISRGCIMNGVVI